MKDSSDIRVWWLHIHDSCGAGVNWYCGVLPTSFSTIERKRSTASPQYSEPSALPASYSASETARRHSLSASSSLMPAFLAIQGNILGAFMLFLLVATLRGG